MPRNAFYAQSGGVTAVINATAAGVIETARAHPNRIGRVLAGRNGIIGALTEDLIDTSRESEESIAALKHTPSGAFGSCRYKLKGLDENRAEYERLIDVFRAHDIGYFFYNGGGDSSDTAFKVSQLGDSLGYPVIAVGIPKTVDNDLPITDNCPGFGSVAKYVAVSIREASFDVASMALTSTKVFILEVMGRHAGWIAAASAAWPQEKRGRPAPSHSCFPEVPFDEAALHREGEKDRAGATAYCVDRDLGGRPLCRDGQFSWRMPGSKRCLRAYPARRRGPGAGQYRQGRGSATSITGRWRTTCSGAARHVASAERCANRPMRWAGPPWRFALGGQECESCRPLVRIER